MEFIYDVERKDFYFLEVNTRLQVEHPVTEAVFGIDLVEWMVRQAAGDDVLVGLGPLVPKGAAIEARVYAENPNAGFRPSAGRLTRVQFADDARIDGWIETGVEVTPFYDPMLAKVIVAAGTRKDALEKLVSVLDRSAVAGIETNLDYLRAMVASSEAFRSGRVRHQCSEYLRVYPADPIDVLGPWCAGPACRNVPGPAASVARGCSAQAARWTSVSFRLANTIVGNPETTPRPRIDCQRADIAISTWNATIGLAGAQMSAKLDGIAVGASGSPIAIRSGETLAIFWKDRRREQRLLGLAVRGGFGCTADFRIAGAVFTLGTVRRACFAQGALEGGEIVGLPVSQSNSRIRLEGSVRSLDNY